MVVTLEVPPCAFVGLLENPEGLKALQFSGKGVGNVTVMLIEHLLGEAILKPSASCKQWKSRMYTSRLPEFRTYLMKVSGHDVLQAGCLRTLPLAEDEEAKLTLRETLQT